MQRFEAKPNRKKIEGLSLLELILSLALVAGFSTATLQGYTTLLEKHRGTSYDAETSAIS
mgnify:CR=1 FL=1